MEQLLLVKSEDLNKIVFSVFNLMLQLRPESVLNAPPQVIKGRKATGIVSMYGQTDEDKSSYSIVLEAPETLAFKIAGAVLMMKVTQWSDLVEDAYAEISNMISGNVKKHLAVSHVLSSPMVLHGEDYRWCVPRVRIVQEHVYRCGEEHFTVSIGAESSTTRVLASRAG